MHERRQVPVEWPSPDGLPCPVRSRDRACRDVAVLRRCGRVLRRRSQELLEKERKEQRIMKRLPGWDRKTYQAEAAIFGALASVAIVLVTIAVADSVRFASKRDAIVAMLEQGVIARAQCLASATATNCAPTNAPAAPPCNSGGKVPGR